MKTLKALCAPRDSVFDIAKRDTVLADYGIKKELVLKAKTA
jgi:hypothetical protein